MDLFSRRIIGWHLSETITQQLTITALWKAWKNRSYATGMLIHSDRGSQYAAAGYRQFLTDYCKATQSMSRKGNCWDNAPVESFCHAQDRRIQRHQLRRSRAPEASGSTLHREHL
ncbi:MAG: DDE-type integrase/transposase/recombinase [Ignavibacteria bacterium]|nr:MAG: DDE-type integrase/transposase/recombinase [Ignavibacteria bacterium]